jgi:hypothetical protein
MMVIAQEGIDDEIIPVSNVDGLDEIRNKIRVVVIICIVIKMIEDAIIKAIEKGEVIDLITEKR